MLQDLFTFTIQNGLPQDTILFLLLLPGVAALALFFRIIIGVDRLQLNRSILLSLGVGSIGLFYGLGLFVAVILLDIMFRSLLGQRRLLPAAKHALSMLVISLALLGVFMGASYFTEDTFINLPLLPLLLIVVGSQGQLSINPGDHPLRPIVWIGGVLAFLGGSFFLLNSQSIQSFALQSPLFWLLLVFAVILFLARFRGLRFVEFFRFHKIISKNGQ